MKHNEFYTYGILTGVLVGAIASVFILRSITKDHALRTKYDEMQKRIRGDAYMYGFYTMVFCEALLSLAELFVTIPADPLVIHFMTIIVGIGVQAGYSIWNNAYVGLNTNMNRFIISMIVIGSINILTAVMAWHDGRMVVDGVVQPPFCNFMISVLFLVLGLIGLLKKRNEKEEAQ